MAFIQMLPNACVCNNVFAYLRYNDTIKILDMLRKLKDVFSILQHIHDEVIIDIIKNLPLNYVVKLYNSNYFTNQNVYIFIKH